MDMKYKFFFSTVSLIASLGGLGWLTGGCALTAPTAGSSGDRATDSSELFDPAASETIKIIGASTPYPALELLAQAYSQETTGVEVVFLDSSQSSGGIEAVKQGLAEIGTVTRLPKPEEADERLTYRAIARDALLVATHPTVTGFNGLTTQQLQDIYSGKITNWKDLSGPAADIIILDRAEDTSAKRLLREYYLGSNLANASDAITLSRESDMVDALQGTAYSIGMLSLAKATRQSLAINHINLDGIEPIPQSIDAGQYDMHRTLGIVWYDQPSPTTQRFIDFVFSPSGSAVLEAAGFAAS